MINLINIWTYIIQPSEEVLSPILYSLGFFMLLILGMTLLIFLTRLKKIYYSSLRSSTIEKFQGLLTAALSRVEDNHARLTAFSAENLIKIHNLENAFSPKQKQYILDEIISYLNSLKGNYKLVLFAFYYKLKLQEISNKKIHSRNTVRIIKGIRELSNVDIYIPWNDIIHLLQKNDPLIREELFYSLAKQSPEKLLHFLEHRHYYISQWDEINIHAAYKKLENGKLPQFSKWFFSYNQRLALFAIKMTGEFQQQSSFADIPVLLAKTKNPLKILAAIEVVGKMGAAELSNTLLHTLYKWIKNEEIVYRILLTVEKLMDNDELSPVVRKLSGYPSFRINLLLDHIISDKDADSKVKYEDKLKQIKQAS